ncbi:MAG: NAD-dependent succinate-semialdehyde dehydrogenase [Bradymonadaceae bacterium]
MRSINPTTGELIAEYPHDTQDDVQMKLTASHEASWEWRLTPIEDRARFFQKAAVLLRDASSHYARRITDEMGKPIKQARSEIEKCAWVCDYFAENAARFLEPRSIDTEAAKSYIKFEPLGSILAIMPWNFPFWQVFRFAAPSMMAGNVVVLKHAPNVVGCALDIQEVFENAGFPPGVFTNLFIADKKVKDVIEHHAISGVTLTGSVGAGRSVAEIAGRALKKTVLELGGSDPFIVLADCDLDHTVEQAVQARMMNNGQSCIAAKRFIVEKPIYETFIQKFHDRLAKLVIGDPTDELVDIGPMARKDLRDDLHRQVRKSIKRGAECLLGGESLEGPGYFYVPTLLTDVDPEMPAFTEETFGPVAAVTMAENTEHAIELANRSAYGLGASIWTSSERGEEWAQLIDAGAVAVNEIVKSDPRLPFGGVKNSGYGRELSVFGMVEFTNVKTIWVK